MENPAMPGVEVLSIGVAPRPRWPQIEFLVTPWTPDSENIIRSFAATDKKSYSRSQQVRQVRWLHRRQEALSPDSIEAKVGA
jgi:hypothetical protein